MIFCKYKIMSIRTFIVNRVLSIHNPQPKTDFVLVFRDSVKPPDFSTPSRKLTADEIEQYWLQWKNIFPPEKDRFWDGLLTGLNNYLPILQGNILQL